jgi:hypothetical protein
MAVSLIGAARFATGAPDPAVEALPSPWDRFFNLRVSGGYNDNVTLAHNAPEQAPFIHTGLEAVVSRVPVDGWFFNFTGMADDSRYLGPGSVDGETVVFALTEGKRQFPSGWQPGVGLQYLYQDQVLDVSTTETNQEALPVRGHSLGVRPGLRLDLTPHWWLSGEVPLGRQYYESPLDDYWESGGKVSAGYTYGHRSEIELGYEPLHRSYDTDSALDADGEPLGGQSKALWQHDVRLAWRHYWDEDRHWRTTLKLGAKANRDNGGGYFDFNRYSAGAQVRYRTRRWEISAEAGVYQYYYPVQTVSGPGSPTRERTEVSASLRCERQIAKHWRVFAEYNREHVLGNVTVEEYSVNQGNAGLSWEF